VPAGEIQDGLHPQLPLQHVAGEAAGTLSLVLLGALVLFTASAVLANKRRKSRADASALVAEP
jgi:hypothetical protein